MSQMDRPYTSFYRHSVVALALYRFISYVYGWFCIANATFAHTPSSFAQNLEMFR